MEHDGEKLTDVEKEEKEQDLTEECLRRTSGDGDAGCGSKLWPLVPGLVVLRGGGGDSGQIIARPPLKLHSFWCVLHLRDRRRWKNRAVE